MQCFLVAWQGLGRGTGGSGVFFGGLQGLGRWSWGGSGWRLADCFVICAKKPRSMSPGDFCDSCQENMAFTGLQRFFCCVDARWTFYKGGDPRHLRQSAVLQPTCARNTGTNVAAQ